MLLKKYPFDPSVKHHFIIAGGLAIWIFLFLFLTEPLDISELNLAQQLFFLPLYGVVGAITYLIFIPIQQLIYRKNKEKWYLKSELLFLIIFLILGAVFARIFYLYVVVLGEPNPYKLYYHLTALILPAFSIILPIIILGRFAFGKYHEKKLEDQKIEIKGEGNYEGIRLFLNDVICIQSSDNYVEVFYVSGNELKKTLIRNKLSVISEEFPEFLRTHRSYLINPFHFLQWKTANSKLFIVASHHIEVPVSRTYQNDVKTILNSTTT